MQVTQVIARSALNIIHNCAKAEENCVLLRKYRFVEAAQQYTEISCNPRKVVLAAVMAISYVREENEASMVSLERGMVTIC